MFCALCSVLYTALQVFLSTDVKPQLKMVELQFEKLLKKPKPAPEKPAANATVTVNGTSTSNGTDTTNSTAGNSTAPVEESSDSTDSAGSSGSGGSEGEGSETKKETDDEL